MWISYSKNKFKILRTKYWLALTRKFLIICRPNSACKWPVCQIGTKELPSRGDNKPSNTEGSLIVWVTIQNLIEGILVLSRRLQSLSVQKILGYQDDRKCPLHGDKWGRAKRKTICGWKPITGYSHIKQGSCQPITAENSAALALVNRRDRHRCGWSTQVRVYTGNPHL